MKANMKNTSCRPAAPAPSGATPKPYYLHWFRADPFDRLVILVVGCESGPNRRPCKIEWVESIVEQCLTASVPVFVKQLDLNGKCERDISKFPAHLRIRQVPWAKEGETI